MKMTIDSPSNEKEKTNFDLLCDVQASLSSKIARMYDSDVFSGTSCP